MPKLPSPALASRADQLSQAALAVRRETDKLIQLAGAEGFKFPDLLDHILRQLSNDLDDIYLLLKPQRLAENLERRDDQQAPSGA